MTAVVLLSGLLSSACDVTEVPAVCKANNGFGVDEPLTGLPAGALLPSTNSECRIRPATWGVEVLDPIEYGHQHERQRMAAYLPIGAERAPAVIMVHGGSWWYGDRGDFHERARHFAARGIAAFSVEYALATDDEPSFPANVQDVVCASRYIKSNAETFGIDPNAMAAYGASAGGHLAAMLGVLEGNEAILDGACGDPKVSPKVRTVMNYFGYVDLEAAAEVDPEDSRVSMMLGATWDEDPELWRLASPASYVEAGDALFVTGHGVDDRVVRPSIAQSFHQTLDAHGIPNVLVMVDEALHGFFVHRDLDQAVRCGFEPLADLVLGAR